MVGASAFLGTATSIPLLKYYERKTFIQGSELIMFA